MIYTIDIGNSNVVAGLWQDDTLIDIMRIATIKDKEALTFYQMKLQEYFLEKAFDLGAIEQIIISSVVPSLNEAFEAIFSTYFGKKPQFINSQLYPNLPIHIQNPIEIGTDLVANALAAHQIYGGNAIVVDFGTALTFTTVSAEGKIIGVSIVPGIKTAIGALFNNTAQLPEVPLESPVSALGTDTVSAIQSGIIFGYTGLVKNMIEAIQKETKVTYKTIATGGLAAILENNLEFKAVFNEVNPILTLTGIRLAGKFFIPLKL